MNLQLWSSACVWGKSGVEKMMKYWQGKFYQDLMVCSQMLWANTDPEVSTIAVSLSLHTLKIAFLEEIAFSGEYWKRVSKKGRNRSLAFPKVMPAH